MQDNNTIITDKLIDVPLDAHELRDMIASASSVDRIRLICFALRQIAALETIVRASSLLEDGTPFHPLYI
jgi:hypothetical protein